MLRPTARFGLATFRFLCAEPIEKKTLAHQLYKTVTGFAPDAAALKCNPVKVTVFQPCPSQVLRQCNRRRYTADKVKNHCYRDRSALQRAAGNSLYLLPALPQLARVGVKITAHNLSYIWPWIEPVTAFCSTRAQGGWRDIKSAL